MSSNDRPYRWPVRIVQSRYGGTYSGGAWLAWPAEEGTFPDQPLPLEPFDDDVSCALWWATNPEAERVGRGATPNDALADMIERNPLDE